MFGRVVEEDSRDGEASVERGCSRLGLDDEVGVEIKGMRRPPGTDVSRGEAIVDIVRFEHIISVNWSVQ